MTDPAPTPPGDPREHEPDWIVRAQRLAALLVERGDVRDDAWAAAVAAVPRHRLVPAAYRQDPHTFAWQRIDTTAGDGLELVYSPETLVTALAGRGENQVAVSSSTKPDLMARMLETLDVHDHHRVLEIGTGTGYNAALLTHRLGDERVFSLDVDPDLVDTARHRLAEIGYHPTLVAVDGVDGLPEHAPYDRIVATCSVPAIPWAWIEQLTPGGHLLADLRLNATAGNLVDVHRDKNPGDDRAEGRFTARYASFMALRHHTGDSASARLVERATDPTRRPTTAPPQPWWTHLVVWFLAQHALPAGVVHGMRLDPDTRHPTAGMLTAPDGSWATVDLTAGPEGTRLVTEAGPTPLWPPVEHAHQQWTDLGAPDWPRFGVTVTPERQWVWLDHPTGPNTWPVSGTPWQPTNRENG